MSSFYQSLVTKPSSLSKCVIASLGLMLLVATGSSSLSCIFFASTFLILLYTACFTLFSSRNPKDSCKPAFYKAEVKAEVSKIVSKQLAHNYLATISENERHIDDNDDSDEEDGCGKVGRSLFTEDDDGSISDEDTLIEIEIPTGHYLRSPYNYKELEHHKYNLRQKFLPDYYWHQQQSWMQELRSEANELLIAEEDNLIEIDISIGSIMCPIKV